MEVLTNTRIESMLKTALGDEVGKYLENPSVIELMLNSDGMLWADTIDKGKFPTGTFISKEDAERVIFIVASSVKAVCSRANPIISAELPGSGSRFQGMLPPVVSSAIFTIRKKALRLYTLEDYEKQKLMSKNQLKFINEGIINKKNILIAGGTSSGKTTLANAILAKIATLPDRLVIIEDTLELQCNAKDFVSLRTSEGISSMTDLLKATMRLRPDRIIIGEVRGSEALTLLKAWNTGHPGGCATIHADSASKSLFRLAQLIEESGIKASMSLIADAVNIIIFIEKDLNVRRIKEVVEVKLSENNYELNHIY